MTPQTIVLPTDFSDCADHALQTALAVATRYDATLHLLHVIGELDPEWYGVGDPDERAMQLRHQIRGEAEARLQEIADAAAVEISTHVVPPKGFDVAATIREHVGSLGADLVVLGTHGRQGLGRLLLGSVADRLIRRAPCPVISVTPQSSLALAQGDPGGVLAPVDFSAPSRQAVEAAHAIAHAFERPLHLLFVAEKRRVPVFSDTGLPGVGVVEMDDEIVANAEAALRQVSASVDGPTASEVHTHVRHGQVADEIADAAASLEAAVVVMATRGLSGVERWMIGSTTDRLVRRAPCPVLTLRPPLQDAAEA